MSLFMKKLIAITLAAVLGLMLSGCKKVQPTSVSFNYYAEVTGTVYYWDSGTNSRGNVASEITVTLDVISGAPFKKYSAVTKSDGTFSCSIPCTAKAGITVQPSVKECPKGNKKYNNKATITSVAIEGGNKHDFSIDITGTDL